MPTLRVNDVDLSYEMARSFRVIAFDVRGHGRSSRPPGPYSVTLFARDAVVLLGRLNATPAHVVGLSMGGMIAFQLVVDIPKPSAAW